MKKKKRALISLITAAVLIFALIISGAGKMFIDTASMGLDYITLKKNPIQKVSSADIEEAMLNRSQSKIFVLASDDDFSRLKENFQKRDSKKLNEYFDYVKECADELLTLPVHEYELDAEEDSILETARNILERVICLSFMYRMTGDESYASRCREELDNACDFPDWHENHFLDTAELTFAVSLGTNWLHDYLSEDDINHYAESVKSKAFDVSAGKILSQNWWKWSKTNWNSVCYSGLAIGAMVFYDRYKDFCSDFLAETYNNIAINFETFTPDGVYVEGTGYWEYCTTYLTYFLSTSDVLLQSDFGLSDIDGLLKVGAFPVYLKGAVSVFNYGDNKAVSVGAPSLYWFSKKTSDPVTAYYQAKESVADELENGKGRFELARECAVGCLWYDEKLLDGLNDAKLPLSVYLKSDRSQEIVAMRSAFFDNNAVYAAIKGGYNYTNHGDLDIGTFVFDALGERWAEDLGPADYGDAGYFVGIIGGGRWKVYAKRAEGQNTLVFNPGSIYEDQYPFAKARFTSFEEDEENGGTAVLDMSEAYRFNGVRSAERTFTLKEGRSVLNIRDKFSCRKASEVFWFMHTKADIRIIDEKHAELKIGDKTVIAVLSEDSAGAFEIMEAVSLKDNVDNRLKGNAEGVRKLAVHADDVKEGVIDVTLIPQK